MPTRRNFGCGRPDAAARFGSCGSGSAEGRSLSLEFFFYGSPSPAYNAPRRTPEGSELYSQNMAPASPRSRM